MNLKISMCGLVAAALALGACHKKNDETTAATPPANPAPVVAAAAPATTGASTGGAVASYPDTTPQSGTVEIVQSFTVHQAADASSPTLGSIGKGTLVDLKGSHADWMLVEYPTGVGQLSPGWLELKSLSDPRVRRAERKAEKAEETAVQKDPAGFHPPPLKAVKK